MNPVIGFSKNQAAAVLDVMTESMHESLNTQTLVVRRWLWKYFCDDDVSNIYLPARDQIGACGIARRALRKSI